MCTKNVIQVHLYIPIYFFFRKTVNNSKLNCMCKALNTDPRKMFALNKNELFPSHLKSQSFTCLNLQRHLLNTVLTIFEKHLISDKHLMSTINKRHDYVAFSSLFFNQSVSKLINLVLDTVYTYGFLILSQFA